MTYPIISAMRLAAADSSRLLLFPDADKFEPIEVIEGSGMDNAYTGSSIPSQYIRFSQRKYSFCPSAACL